MNKIKKGLGRGLSSLIGETKVENKSYLTEKLVPQPQLECALGLS